MTKLLFDNDVFEIGSASRADLSPEVILIAKKEGEEGDTFYPLDFSIDDKADFMQQVRETINASDTDSIIFEVECNQLPKQLNDLFFDENTEPTEYLFQFGKLAPHTQDVIASYVQTDLFEQIQATTLQEIVSHASASYIGKYDSKADYASYLFDEDMFAVIDGVLDANVLASFVDFEGLGEHITSNINQYEIINNHYFN